MRAAAEPPSAAAARRRLVVALDFDTVDRARALVDRLEDDVDFYKVGLGLQLAGGDRFARELKDRGKRVFLDYKYYDIPETVKNAVARAADLGVDYLTVHGVGSILRGAVEGRGRSPLKLLCVTVLTSLDAQDLEEMGFPRSVAIEELVAHRALRALDAGMDGVIASPHEARRIRDTAGKKLLIFTPGIRPSGAAADDQKRVATPSAALAAGADHLVVGRPIAAAPDPKAAARAILAEIASAAG